MDAELSAATGQAGRHPHRSRRAFLAVGALVLVLAACGGSTSAPLENAGKAVDGSGGGVGAAPAYPAPSAAASAAPAVGSGSTSQSNAADTAQIIKTGTLTLEVADIAKAVDAAQASVGAVGGYVSASQRSNAEDQARASVTFRIPAARWDDALGALRRVGTKVVDEQTSAVEVTGQVLDLGARITNLQVTEAALQGIMARATKIPDVLAVEQQLSDVQGQIEQLSTQRKHLTDQAAYGTLTVSFGLHTVAVTQVTKDWNPGGEIDRAVASLVGIGQGLVVFGVWFMIVWLPVLAGLAVLGLVAWLVLRRLGVLRRPDVSAPTLPTAAEH